jgi:hypothetical protein
VGYPEGLVNNNWFDIGPHVGMAYRAFEGAKSMVIRAGFATNYFPVPIYGWNDRFRLNMPFTGFYQNYELTAANQSPDGRANYGLVSSPRWIAGKNTRDAIQLDNPRGIGAGGDAFWVAYFEPDQPSSRVHDWHFTIEKELGQDNVVRVQYVGNRATHQDSYDSLNETIPDYVWYQTRGEKLPEGDLADQLRRPFSNYPYGQVENWRKDGWSNSHGAVIGFERRYSRGIGMQVFYQLINVSKAAGHGWFDDSMVRPTTSFLPSQVPADRKERMNLLLYARDTSVPQHEVRWNWLADLPFGKGKPLLRNANRFVDAVIGGWQVSGLGRWRSTWTMLPTDLWPTGQNVEYYGHKYPIEDCRSGSCIPGYLLWNGYIPAHQVNQPDGIKGVPANYKPAVAPLWPFPADYKNRNAQNDPNYGNYGDNLMYITLKDGTRQEVYIDGTNALHPFINQPMRSTGLWTMDASLFKSFAVREQMRLRVQVDFFNVTNTPGNEYSAGNNGIVLTNVGKNDPRQMQLSARFSW